MILQIAFLFPISFLSLVLGQGNSPTYNFEMFLQNSLKNYPAWLRANNFDPTVPSATETVLLNHTLYLKVLCTIREDQVVGHANQTNNLTVVAEVDIKRQFFTLRMQNKGVIQFQGKYSANGTPFMEQPFSGNGSWKYTSQDGLFENATYRFAISENGYLEISEDRREYNVSLSNPSPVELDGILKQELDRINLNNVKEMFAQEYKEKRLGQINPDRPTANILHQYLLELFQKTEYSSIIGAVNPNPTEPSSPKTTSPTSATTSTQAPQDNLVWRLHPTGNILFLIWCTFLLVMLIITITRLIHLIYLNQIQSRSVINSLQDKKLTLV